MVAVLVDVRLVTFLSSLQDLDCRAKLLGPWETCLPRAESVCRSVHPQADHQPARDLVRVLVMVALFLRGLRPRWNRDSMLHESFL